MTEGSRTRQDEERVIKSLIMIKEDRTVTPQNCHMSAGRDIEIRSLKAEEVAAICTVDRQAFWESPFGECLRLDDMPEERRSRWQSVKDFGAYCTKHPERVLVAVLDGKMVGFATFDCDTELRAGRVVNCAVLRSFRGLGIGTQLVRRLLDELRSLGIREARVETSYEPAACRMYEKTGFELTGRERGTTDEGKEYWKSEYRIELK